MRRWRTSAELLGERSVPPCLRATRPSLRHGGGLPKADKRAVNKSITPDALISFVDNKPYKTLKRHLGRRGLDMASYRERYGLPSTYPSVAPNYSAARSEMAKKLGLGAQRRGAGKPATESASPAPAAKGRKKAAAPSAE